MPKSKDEAEGVAVPQGRLVRMAQFGRLAGGIAGNVLNEGARGLARGERPSLNDLVMTPQNAGKVADHLSRLRGAAMKFGQLLSMDAGDFLPPELSEVLARLRSSADHMPPQQLRRVLNDAWGKEWLKKFEKFEVRPMAAASIGQVHRGVTKDGRDVAIKIQYPGVKQSIDSDVDNVATILKMSGQLPKGMNIQPLLEEAKRQLHEEADYVREGRYLNRFRDILGDDDRFWVPSAHDDLTTDTILTMDYLPGAPIEDLVSAPQDVRDRIASRLFELVIRELFEFKLMQTDPNFANYRYAAEGDRVILLDFGATRALSDELSEAYRLLARGGRDNDYESVRDAAERLGYVSDGTDPRHSDMLADVLFLAMETLRHQGPFDFGASDLARRLQEKGMAFRNEKTYTDLPNADCLFIHRKIGGLYLLASRLKARVDISALTAPYLAE